MGCYSFWCNESKTLSDSSRGVGGDCKQHLTKQDFGGVRPRERCTSPLVTSIFRFLAMGLDGGTIPSRSDLLRRAAGWTACSSDETRSSRGGNFRTRREPGKVSADQATDLRQSMLKFCALSQKQFFEKGPGESHITLFPIVCDRLGNLFLREAVLEFLYGSEPDLALRRAFPLLRGPTDFFSIHPANLLASAERQGKRPGAATEAVHISVVLEATVPLWTCPLSGEDALTSQAPFAALRPCGHILSVKAVSVLCSAPRTQALLLQPEADSVPPPKSIRPQLHASGITNLIAREQNSLHRNSYLQRQEVWGTRLFIISRPRSHCQLLHLLKKPG